MKMKIMTGVAALMAVTLASSCSDDFLEEKKLWGKDSEQTVYTQYATAVSRIDNIYYMLYPGQKEGNGMYGNLVSTGTDDAFAKSTEEYGGLSDFENSTLVLSYDYNGNFKDYDHFYVENKETSPYGHIREINEVIENVQKYGKGALTDEQYNNILGQAYFLRAWRYWLMVRWYGGVPIIDHVQNALVGNGEGLDLVVPRSSTKECIEFICNDLDEAANLLPSRWENDGEDWGRVTSGTALALKGRILLNWASPLWNRKNDVTRWQQAYDANKAAIEELAKGGYGLAYENDAGAEKESAANWAKMFLSLKGSDGNVNEAVFVTLYNNVQKTNNYNKWNSWEQTIRPKNAYGGGGKHPTSEMVDLFPMADGKKPGLSSYDYDKLCFFMNRDPRFYRTFAFPGEKWTYSGNTMTDLTDESNDVTFAAGAKMRESYPYNGSDYVLWSYTFYKNADDKTNESKSGYGADGLGSMSGRSSVYVCKRSDDMGINGSPLYKYNTSSSSESTDGKGFSRSATPFMEMRYAEVLLNYAEAAAALGGHDDEAMEILKRIRSRVYDSSYAATNYGLESGLTGGALMAAILYERQIEFAYEGKRFDDMRRWLLFDGGVGHEQLGENFRLTGWGGNTCAWLGLTPTNGRAKYHYIEIYTDDVAADEDFKSDPLQKKINRNSVFKGLDINDRLSGQGNLKSFYDTYFSRKDKTAEGNDDNQAVYWPAKMYILGLDGSAMTNNPTLYQNVGWEDLSHGGMGIFDPLEEDSTKIPVDTDTGYE